MNFFPKFPRHCFSTGARVQGNFTVEDTFYCELTLPQTGRLLPVMSHLGNRLIIGFKFNSQHTGKCSYHLL